MQYLFTQFYVDMKVQVEPATTELRVVIADVEAYGEHVVTTGAGIYA